MKNDIAVACPVLEKHIKVVLVGQPNVGKSMLTNAMSNAHLHVGNFTGVTVEKTEVYFEYKDYNFTIIDLPGTYMLNDYSIEERVTHEYLMNEEYDLILNVVDSTNMEKNFQLTSELMSLSEKMVLALNMSDDAQKEGIIIDEVYLSQLLGLDAIKVSAAQKIGLKELLDSLVQTYENSYSEAKLVFSEAVEEEITRIGEYLDKHKYYSHISNRHIAIHLLQNEQKTYQELHDNPLWTELQPILIEADKHIELHHGTEDIKEIFAEEYASFNSGIIAETVTYQEEVEKLTLTEKIDKILIHRFFGIPIFLFFMWTLFQLTFELGSIPMDWIDGVFSWFGTSVGKTIANDEIRSLVVDGIISGVGAVVLFVPNIVILFVGIALLESTGYMSRVAFLLDGIFHKFGLHGQSFIPLVTGFGCSIPAYMSARILKNDRDRLLTLFIIGFMSCGARLPVYVLFTGAFFSEDMAGNILFLIYISGAILGLLAAKILKMTVFKAEDEPFVMEMPKYRMPSSKLIYHTVQTKTWMYLKKAGTFIAAASMLVWFLSNYPNVELTQKENLTTERMQELRLENSYLGQIGKFMEPAFEPIGFDWKMTVALQAGLAAKEVVVSTLGVLYSLGDEVDQDSRSLANTISKNISFASAVSFIVFVMIYLPCLAASIVFTREAGGIKYFVALFIFTSVTAYILSFIAYRVSLLL